MTYGSAITGLAGYRPSRVVTNEDLAGLAGVTPQWIEERTGIRTRHECGPDEDILSMAITVATKALTASGVDRAEVDLVVLATATKLQLIPGWAPQVASGMGLRCGAFDLNAVCGGFSYALAMASNAVKMGDARNAIVIGAEQIRHMLQPEKPDTFVIFGDGAGAAVVSRSEHQHIGPAVWGSDGSREHVIYTERVGAEHHVFMDGPSVYKWSTKDMPAAARKACDLAGVSLDDVRWFVPHQANRRIVDTLARVLRIPDEWVARDVVVTGNTSSASIPLALNALRESGRTSPGDLALLIGFGAGVTYAGQVVRLP